MLRVVHEYGSKQEPRGWDGSFIVSVGTSSHRGGGGVRSRTRFDCASWVGYLPFFVFVFFCLSETPKDLVRRSPQGAFTLFACLIRFKTFRCYQLASRDPRWRGGRAEREERIKCAWPYNRRKRKKKQGQRRSVSSVMLCEQGYAAWTCSPDAVGVAM